LEGNKSGKGRGPLWGHKGARLNNGEGGKYFGGIHSSGVSQAARRIGEKMVTDKGLREIIQELESLLRILDCQLSKPGTLRT
jgi:small ligand-binding sensory domain FIST